MWETSFLVYQSPRLCFWQFLEKVFSEINLNLDRTVKKNQNLFPGSELLLFGHVKHPR